MDRFAKALVRAIPVALATMFVTFAIGIWMVRDSRDGQAGMGPFFGAIFLGAMTGIIVFSVSLYRNSPSQKSKDDGNSRSL